MHGRAGDNGRGVPLIFLALGLGSGPVGVGHVRGGLKFGRRHPTGAQRGVMPRQPYPGPAARQQGRSRRNQGVGGHGTNAGDQRGEKGRDHGLSFRALLSSHTAPNT